MGKDLQSKSLCKWGKEEIIENIEQIYELTADPKYVCEKCARVARTKSNVCKPHRFKKK